MTTGTGLDGQLGFAAETTPGTPVTVSKFVEFDSETLQFTDNWLEPTGIRAGQKYKRDNRVQAATRTVSGAIVMEHATRDMGLLWKQALGSALSAPVLVSGTAYKQIHVPGDFLSKALTIQVGRPEAATGTVRPHTYTGCKFTDWEFSVEESAIPTLTFTVDGTDESTSTALASASYTAGARVFSFSQATVFKLGGTATTTTGVTSIASGVQVATVVKKLTIKGTMPMAGDRYGVGNAGVKKEQLENGTPMITGSLDAEFNKTEFYDVFKAGTSVPMQVSLIGNQIASTGSFDTLDFVIPAVRFKDMNPSVAGPDIVRATVNFEGYQDATGNPVIQVTLISADATF